MKIKVFYENNKTTRIILNVIASIYDSKKDNFIYASV